MPGYLLYSRFGNRNMNVLTGVPRAMKRKPRFKVFIRDVYSRRNGRVSAAKRPLPHNLPRVKPDIRRKNHPRQWYEASLEEDIGRFLGHRPLEKGRQKGWKNRPDSVVSIESKAQNERPKNPCHASQTCVDLYLWKQTNEIGHFLGHTVAIILLPGRKSTAQDWHSLNTGIARIFRQFLGTRPTTPNKATIKHGQRVWIPCPSQIHAIPPHSANIQCREFRKKWRISVQQLFRQRDHCNCCNIHLRHYIECLVCDGCLGRYAKSRYFSTNNTHAFEGVYIVRIIDCEKSSCA